MCFVLKYKNSFRPKPRGQISISFENLEYLACGESSIVYGIDDKTVLKEYTDVSDGENIIERQAYQRLDLHPHVAKYLGTTSNGSIVFEHPGAVRISLWGRIRWLKQFAKGLEYMHKKEMVHADVGCHNATLVKHDCLKIIDFEGCSIDGGAASSCYEWFSYRRSTPRISKQTDIFAYGCMVYEVITGKRPHEELEASDHRTHLIEQRYAQGQFPDVENLPLGGLMHGCWYGTISSMGEAIQVLQRP